jgi:hypothetical protein
MVLLGRRGEEIAGELQLKGLWRKKGGGGGEVERS